MRFRESQVDKISKTLLLTPSTPSTYSTLFACRRGCRIVCVGTAIDNNGGDIELPPTGSESAQRCAIISESREFDEEGDWEAFLDEVESYVEEKG